MTIDSSTTGTLPAPTRPQLQAINQNFSDLGEQIRQATQIISLPDNWSSIKDEEVQSHILQSLVRARAEWVLRWILDKLKDETDVGRQSRAFPRAWQLLDWMIRAVPISRGAPHLRDAHFLSILENALAENFNQDAKLQPASRETDVHMGNTSESSETIQEEPKLSRKRKRGTSSTASSSKKVTVESNNLAHLFHWIIATVKSIKGLATPRGPSEDVAYTENMQMVLRTESSQAARILKLWLEGIQQLLSFNLGVGNPTCEEYLDLSHVLQIWELRNTEAIDSGASAEEFSSECLIPILLLCDSLRMLRTSAGDINEMVINDAIQSLDQLVARHLFAPSRAAFFADAGTDPSQRSSSISKRADLLASSLGPLRAKLLQAAQIKDSGISIPINFAPMFNAISQLLDLAVRASPSRTPKSRITEKPWLQAVFLELADSAGCSLQAPEFAVVDESITAVVKALGVLQLYDVRINSEILRDLFWYHSGLKYPGDAEKRPQWSLIAAIIELDPISFLTEPKRNSTSAQERPADLVGFLFDGISSSEIAGSNLSNPEPMELDQPDDGHERFESRLILDCIVVPIMSAFAQSRNLLGFFRNWDNQLSRGLKMAIWQDRKIPQALKELLEPHLTHSQISKLFQEYAEKLKLLHRTSEKVEALNRSSSSAVIIPAMIQSVRSDDTIEILRPQLLSLLTSYSMRVQDGRLRTRVDLATSWLTLCQLLQKLWAVELHGSLEAQKALLYPLIEQSIKDGPEAQHTNSEDVDASSAATLFLLNSCEYLQFLPNTEDVIKRSLRKLLKSLSSDQLKNNGCSTVFEVFCSNGFSLLERLELEGRQKSLLKLLLGVSRLDQGSNNYVINALSQSIFQHGGILLQNDYARALVQAFEQLDKGDAQNVVLDSFFQLNPSSVSREVRESILNTLTSTLDSAPQQTATLLSIMTHIMEVPNATSKLSSDGTTFFDIAQKLHDGKLESPSTLRLLQNLVQLTLGHIIPNQSQTQNKDFLAKFQSKIASSSKKAKKCPPANLAILRATMLSQREGSLLTLDRYVPLLQDCLASASSNDDALLLSYILDAFNELPLKALRSQKLFESVQSFLRDSLGDDPLLQQSLETNENSAIRRAQTLPQLHSTIVQYQLYGDVGSLVDLTLQVLRGPIVDQEKFVCLGALRETFLLLTNDQKLQLVPTLTRSQDQQDRVVSYRILSVLVSTLTDKHDANAQCKQAQLELLPEICNLLEECADHVAFNVLLDSVNTILNDKPFLTSQYSIECVIAMLVKLISHNSPALSPDHAPAIFSRLCDTSRLIILIHRSRLGGRFHLVLPLLQGLLFCLFVPHAGRGGALPPWLKSSTASRFVRLDSANASRLARLLATLCSPTQSSVQKSTHHLRKSTSSTSASKKDLNDPVKAAREYASSYLYPLLASFCRFQLSGRLVPSVRDKLMPGIWEVVGCASLDRESVDAMFAGLDRSTRDVWRGVWGEWERLHGRKHMKAVDAA